MQGTIFFSYSCLTKAGIKVILILKAKPIGVMEKAVGYPTNYTGL